MVYTLRLLAAAALIGAVVTTVNLTREGDDNNAGGLVQAIQRVAAAQSIQLEIVRGDRSSRAWMRRPGQLRIESPDGTYRIVRDRQEWSIDERANRATVRPAAYFAGAEGELDVLALVGARDTQVWRKAIEEAAPQRVNRAGKDWDLYVVRPAETAELACLECWSIRRPGTSPS